MLYQVLTLSGWMLTAWLTEGDFWLREPIEVMIDNPRTGEVKEPIMMEVDQFVDLMDLMS